MTSDSECENGPFFAHVWSDIGTLLTNINNARAFCDRMLGDSPNSQQLAYLTRIKAILAGDDDGGTANGGADGR
jgi:hypothetical protein